MALIPWWISYPNVNDEIMNLDWLLRVSNENTEKISNFINLNTIKYADPILWDITSQYESNTIVVDPQNGDAYISTQAVPYGVHLSNSDYWTKIYNYADAINTLEEQIAAANEHLSTTASADRLVGDLVWLDGQLYKITAPMIAGDSYVIDSNCSKTTIEQELQLEKTTRTNADTALGERITSESEARTDADEALGKRIDNTDEALGKRIDNTNDYVNATNINTFINVLQPRHNLEPLDNTGVSDNTSKLQAIVDFAIANNCRRIYFPSGTYLFNDTINVNSSFLLFYGEEISTTLIIGTSNKVLFNVTGTSSNNIQHIDFDTLTFAANDSCYGCTAIYYEYVNQYRVHNCKFHSLMYHVDILTCQTGIINDNTFYMNTNLNQDVVFIRMRGITPSSIVTHNRMSLSLIRGTSYGIQHTGAADIIVSENTIGGGTYGVSFTNPNNNTVVGDIKIINNEMERQTMCCIAFNNIRNTSNKMYNSGNMIAFNYFNCYLDEDNSYNGTIQLNSSEGCMIIGNTFDNFNGKNGVGVLMNTGERHIIANNLFNNMLKAIKLMSITKVNINGNEIYNPSFNGLIGITIAGCSNIIIDDNQVYNNETAISVSATSSYGICHDNMFTGSIIVNSNTVNTHDNYDIG